jgi:multidrug resistance efflux pump
MSDAAAFVPLPSRPISVSSARRGRGWARRHVKFGAALALLSAGGYAVLSGQGYVASDNAVVSAYTVSLRTPIAGYVSGLRAKVGDTVAAGAVLGRLNEPRVDDQRLIDLENLLARFRSDRQAYEHHRDQLSLQRAGLVERAAERNRSEADFLSLQAAEAERQVRARAVARDYARRDLDRKNSLSRTGDAPTADVDKARSAAEQADREVDAGMARLAYLRVQADAARKGMLLESGSNDVPYSSQRADEIGIRLAEIEREIAYLSAYEAETSARLEAERRRVELLRTADLVAPSSGMLWKLGASEGERLHMGDTVAELVDCKSAFIVATIPQDRYPDVEIGGAARVRLSGEKTDWVGRVISVTGEATLANDRNLAAAPLVQRAATATARIQVAASGNSAGECLVGRTARVLLPTSADSGPLARLARRLL